MVESDEGEPSEEHAQTFGLVHVRSSETDGVHTIRLAGELDVSCTEPVETEILRAESTGARTIVIDLSGLQFIDSTGLRLLVEADRRCPADMHDGPLRSADC
jgi:anti-anti-sigma factor